MRCACGHNNPGGWQFCGFCGRPSPPGGSVPGVRAPPMPAHAAASAGVREFLPGSVPGAPAEPLAAPRHVQTQHMRTRREIPHEDMTRYLSAAVTFDSDLAKNVIENILEE